jgi:NodT family efflux transporter outer membrane factor (OMF) lipoprotein
MKRNRDEGTTACGQDARTTADVTPAPHRGSVRPLAIAIGAALVLEAACTLGPNYQRPKVEVPPAFHEAPPSGWIEAQPRDEIAKGDWWIVFGDPVLNDLERQAIVANQSLKAAVGRVDQARAQARVTQAQLYPAVNADISLSRQHVGANRPVPPGLAATSYSYNTFTLPPQVSYEADIFGKVRRSVEASQADYQASVSDYQTVLLTLKSNLAQDYFNLRYLDADRAVLSENIKVQADFLDFTRRRYEGGLASGLDVAAAETQLNTTKALYVGDEKQRDDFEHAIAVLLGEPASEFSLPENPLNLVPPVLPSGLPSDLLERRPDVAEAERRVAAANARIGVARTAYFPDLSLTGGGGYLSSSLTNLLAGPSSQWFLAALLAVPVFQGGRIKANYQFAQGVYREAVDNYRQQVLTAFQQVEDALSDLRVLEEQGRAQDTAVRSSQRTVNISTARYKEGLAEYLEVLSAENTLLQNQRLSTGIVGMRLVATVQLIDALGGGWADRPVP